ncbi:allophanate hydrolase [Cribrihabitans marinus]|uniref:Allophanate hydrolase n=1 Tax=Cribrihabitans marinus TaxID=1227549 RepID=A0A1H6ZGI4_9RHOB|nr:urea amidolyase [Cribrihabitans marinus]GGH31422.1 allophanate hydrolase [Cribrihabitans marinus]SEJ47945.1 allophanate hydrolase [Cribrihabitans marinus]
MTRELIVHRAGPGVTVQDLGRPGYLAFGLSRGGAADRLALAEGAALLGQGADLAAVEMAGMGGEFEAGEDLRIALTGAPMRAAIDGARVAWNASHFLPSGARLSIGAVEAGSYGYLHLGGGLDCAPVLGARGAHLAAGIGAPLEPGARLPVGKDSGSGGTGMVLDPAPRFDGGTLRILPSLQTDFFDPAETRRFESIAFRRDTRGNRMGVRLLPDGDGFHSSAGLSVLSEVIVPGDVQITGDGTPYVLLSECQTTGGYPRIGTVLPVDLPRVAQAQAGATLRFRFVTLDEAVGIERQEQSHRAGLRKDLQPLIRDPRRIPDLLSYQLVSGVTAGDD